MAQKKTKKPPHVIVKDVAKERVNKPSGIAVILSVALIILLGVAAYVNSVHNPFLWDDILYIRDNYPIHHIENIPSLFTKNITSLNENNFYRPIQMASYALNYYVSALSVEVYHWTNISFHILAGVLVFWLSLVLLGRLPAAVMAGALFVSHPIHVEAVTYISGRADSMAACFLLLTSVFFILHIEKSKFYLLPLAVLSFVLGLLSKENVLIAPILLMAYGFFYKKTKSDLFLRLTPFLLIGFVYVFLRQTVLHFDHNDLIATKTSLLDRIPLIFDSFFRYLGKLLVPVHLHMEYPLQIPSISSSGVLLGVILLISFLAFIVRYRANNKTFAFLLSWFLIMFVPISNIFPLNAFFYEHWVYTPSIGLFILFGLCIDKLSQISKLVKFLCFVLVAGILAGSISLTMKQNRYWGDPELFFKRTLSYNPHSSRVMSELALYYIVNNRLDEGIEYGQKVLALKPDFYIVNVNLASAYMKKGMIDQSIAQSRMAIKLKPDSAPARINLANGYLRKMMFEDALIEFDQAVKLDPTLPDSYNGRGAALINLSKYPQAIEDLNKALSIKPDFSDAYSNRGVAYEKLGDFNKALADYVKSIELDPHSTLPYLNRAKLMYRLKNYDKAIADSIKAIELNPREYLGYDICGLSYNEMRNFPKAIEYFNKVLELKPDDSETYYNRALAYDQMGNSQRSMADYSKAIEINPLDPLAYNNRGTIFANNNQPDKAILDFTKAIEVNPQNAAAYNNRGTMNSRKGNYDKALEDYLKAVDLDHQYPEAMGNISIVYYFKSDFEKSWEYLHKAKSIGYKPNPNFLQDLQKASGRQD